jgi:hypothetical protein
MTTMPRRQQVGGGNKSENNFKSDFWTPCYLASRHAGELAWFHF